MRGWQMQPLGWLVLILAICIASYCVLYAFRRWNQNSSS